MKSLNRRMRPALPIILLLPLVFVAGSALARQPLHAKQETNVWEAPHLVFTNVANADRPVWIGNADDGSARVFFGEQGGTVRIVGKETPFLNLQPLSTNTGIYVIGQGPLMWPPQRNVALVSVAFPPFYGAKGYFFVSYFDYDQGGVLKISRFATSANPDQADAASEQVIGSYGGIGCHGGQVVFAPDGILYLNLSGPVANAQFPGQTQDLDALSGKMVAILNESGPLLSGSGQQTYWPFDAFFSATDCSVIGGEFDRSLSFRMNGIFFYADAYGTVWALKPTGTNWTQLHLANPTFNFDWGVLGISTGGGPVVVTTNGGTGILTITDTGGVPGLTPGTNGSAPSLPPAVSVGATGLTSTSGSTVGVMTGSAVESASQGSTGNYPFWITAFGQDEAGRVYAANYGAKYYVQEPPPVYSKELISGGGIYRIDDDPLQFTVNTVVTKHGLTLEWASIPGILYLAQVSFDQSHWTTFRKLKGTGGLHSISNLSKNPRFHFRVIAMFPQR